MVPAVYVKTVHQYGPKPLLARLEFNGNPYYHGMIIVRKDSPISSLNNLQMKTFSVTIQVVLNTWPTHHPVTVQKCPRCA
ncbi:MAG: PhnD/SsuA/transferrin family substrate-binding protein [Desulfobulbaceae bacterium]|nr:PhnD/SsuA/transferrin family substrate-binding protein [Desulfobulbaceae bacterium]